MGTLFLVQGIETLARRRDIPFGIVQLVMGSAVMFSLLRKRPVVSWIRTGILALWAIAGIVDIALGRWVWGLFLAITGVLLIFVFRTEREQRL